MHLGCSRPCHLKSLMLVRKTERTADVIFSASSNFITGGSDERDSFDRVCPRSHNRHRGRLDLSADDIQQLQNVPVRASVGIPTDPTLYRFHAMMQMYGPALKALAHEKFGDGIISAINFRLDIQKVPDSEGGDSAVITLNGKFQPVKPY
jgi:hypothetical protein